jgi:hypothetical protein
MIGFRTIIRFVLIGALGVLVSCRASQPNAGQLGENSRVIPSETAHAFVYGEFTAVVNNDGSVFLEIQSLRRRISGPDPQYTFRIGGSQTPHDRQVKEILAILRLQQSADDLASFLEETLATAGPAAAQFRPLANAWVQRGEIVFRCIALDQNGAPAPIRLSEKWRQRLQQAVSRVPNESQ